MPSSPLYPSKTYRARSRPLSFTNVHTLQRDSVTSSPLAMAVAVSAIIL